MEVLERDPNTIAGLQRALKILPSGLDAMYKLTLARILAASDADALLAQRALVILAHVYLPLGICDLQQALAVADNQSAGPDGLIPADLILAACGGLVETVKNIRPSQGLSPRYWVHQEVRFVRESACAIWSVYVTEARFQTTPPRNLSFNTSVFFELPALVLTHCSRTFAWRLFRVM